MPEASSAQEVATVIELKRAGLTDREIFVRTGVPISTIRAWRRRGYPVRAGRVLGLRPPAPGREPLDPGQLAHSAYAYLLGLYLGDGHLSRWGAGWTLRLVLDDSYPGVVDECCETIEQIRGRRPIPVRDYGGRRCVRIASSWIRWPVLFPQHGPGRKHARSIDLAGWQREIVDALPGRFLRGLIHSDGWRGVNRVHVKGKDYEYPRYQFSNRSDDIRHLFCNACDRLDVEWRPWTRYHVSVAKRASVAILDRHVGPKA